MAPVPAPPGPRHLRRRSSRRRLAEVTGAIGTRDISILFPHPLWLSHGGIYTFSRKALSNIPPPLVGGGKRGRGLAPAGAQQLASGRTDNACMQGFAQTADVAWGKRLSGALPRARPRPLSPPPTRGGGISRDAPHGAAWLSDRLEFALGFPSKSAHGHGSMCSGRSRGSATNGSPPLSNTCALTGWMVPAPWNDEICL